MTARHDDDEQRVWTVEAVRQLGMTTDLPTAAEIIGIGRTHAYELVKSGRFPVRVLRLGGRVLIPTQAILTYLTGDGDDGGQAATAPAGGVSR